ncbi:MAG: CpaF family protein [Candidatus Riflebacteria bacterium]|nr:CpaF family protein [Candidatus Riflebacteria bacterium]
MASGKRIESVFCINHPRAAELEQLFRDIVRSVAQDEGAYNKLNKEKNNNKYDRLLLNFIQEKFNSLTDGMDLKLHGEEKKRFFEDVLDDIKGLGPVEQLLRDPEVTEIMVNGPNCIFVEKGGKNCLTPLRFIDREHLLSSIQEIVGPVNRRIDISSPMVDARLPNGSRVNAVINPVALDGPYLTIRKFPENRHSLEKLIQFGSITAEIAEFFRIAVQARLNIMISGGTGTGKTTMLNVLSEFISPESRIVIVEDTAELTIHKGRKNVCRLEVRPANLEGKGEISIRQLVRNTLRMRPDRIVVGEVRGEEAFDLVQAMNTGHDGSLTTLHANSCRDALHRLEAMVIMAGTNLTQESIRDLITSAINLVVHLARFRDGSRKIVEVTAVEPAGADGKIKAVPLWTYSPDSVSVKDNITGEYLFHGIPEQTRERIEAQGYPLPEMLSTQNLK